MVQAFHIHTIKIKSSEAIKRDEQRNFAEALKQYAACFLALGQVLKEETLYEELKTNAQTYKQVVQAVKITKMCFERVSDIIEKEVPNAANNNNSSSSSSPPNIGGSGGSSASMNHNNMTPLQMPLTMSTSFYGATGSNSSSSGLMTSLTPPTTTSGSTMQSLTNSSLGSVSGGSNSSLRSSTSFAYPFGVSSTMYSSTTHSQGLNNNSSPSPFNATSSSTPTSLTASNSFNNVSFQSSISTASNASLNSSSFMAQPSSPTLTAISKSNNPLSKSMIVSSSTNSTFYSNRKSVELSSPNIQFQPPPGATFNTRAPSPEAYKPSLSEVTSFGLDPAELSAKEKRKSLSLQALEGDGADVTREGDNAWSKFVRTKFITNYHKERTFKTRDELFDRELLALESAADQWERIRSHILNITDLISQHPINNLLIYFTQKFNEEFQVKEDTVWLSVHDANKQISELASAIVVELTPLWACLQMAELRHYVTKALTEGIVKRVYRTLVEVYETQQQNKTIEEKLNAIGIVTLQDLGVDDAAIIEASDSFEPAIQILDNINVGKTPYAAIDSLVAMYAKVIELVNNVSNFDTISDTTLYGLMLYIIQLSNTQNLPSTLNLIHDYVQYEELSQDEKDIISLLENVIDWANQFEV
ncbi:hypothetical protein FDP41_002596 [Naegleria fowleri]|uniref:VPS9 domain-containing protein n=1 Tax=Naegleria fowleri TaxID=5763 RepID=A0A6A5BUJ4_NAEFO|nr:uncharacterized protein FDP41_002596 [Naegleria fowleri]KAF0978081.1 hypothetical protein FDP41_002596 [Naegleria fowleri]